MKAITILICMATVGVILYWIFCGPLVEPKDARKRIDAQTQVESIEQCVFALSYRSNQLNQILSENGKLDNGQLFDVVAATKPAIIYMSNPEWKVHRRFIDPWGHDYLFLLGKATNDDHEKVWSLKVRSLGPNGVDENGKGDDITSRGSLLRP